MKNRIQKEKEQKIKNQMEKEKKLEYRMKRMHKLYSSKNILDNNNNHIITEEIKIKAKNKKNYNVLNRSCDSLPTKKNKQINKGIYNDFIHNEKTVLKEKNKIKKRINLSFDDKTNEGNYQNNKFKEKYRMIDTSKVFKISQIFKEMLVMTQRKYNKKIKTMIKLSKIYEEELNNVKIDKKNIEKENNLNKLLESINDEIERYKNKINILVIE